MNETRIALALVALAVALLVGTFAYLAYDEPLGRETARVTKDSPAATPEDREDKRPGAQAESDGPKIETDPRSIQAQDGGPAPSGEVTPPSGRTPPNPPASAPLEADPPAAQGGGGVPAYDAPIRESYADGITEVVAETDATGEEEMRLVASHLASDYPGSGVLLIEFRERTNGAAHGAKRETGFALVFESREAALAPYLRYTEEEVDEIFEEDGGIRAVSYEDLGEEDPSLKGDLERISRRS